MSDDVIPEGFLDDLDALVHDDGAAHDRWGELLATHDGARDLLHDARAAAAALGEASADYAPPSDLAEHALASLDARASAAPAPEAPPEPAPASPRRAPWIPVAAAVAALGAFAWASTPGGDDPDPSTESLAAAWRGEVAQVVRAVEGGPLIEGLTGLSAVEGGQRADVREGTALTPGTTLATDERTRAVFALADGSRIALNRSTELAFPREIRAVNLTRGELLAEVFHDPALPNARLRTPHGTVEVLGTKFALTASDAQTSVRVTRGVVRLRDRAGQVVEVRAGEEGVASERGLRVVPATDLAASLRWASLPAAEDAPELRLDDAPVPGLGELRAHVPGERQEQDRALRLADHRVRVRIAGNVARTEIEETFESDEDAVLEGVYRFPLPPDARIASLALEVDGAWEEGAFLSKETAKRIWRGVIRNATPETQRRNQEEWIWVPGPWRDPALLEWQRGGRFELRIFPIPARGARRVRIAYEQTLPRVETAGGSSRRYVYPLAHAHDGSAEVGRFDLDVRVAGEGAPVTAQGYALEAAPEAGATRLRFTRERFRPAGDLVLAVERPEAESPLRSWAYRGPAVAAPPATSRESEEVRALQAELAADARGYVVFALRPELPRVAADVRRDYVLLVDSSQSMVGERTTRARRLARTMAGELDRRDRVMAIACDLACRASALSPSGPGAAEAVFAHLAAEEPAGSSNLAFALRRGLELARSAGAGAEGRVLQLVYLGDGAASAGPRTPGLLTAATTRLFETGGLGEGARLTTVGIGQDADTPALAALARAGSGQHVAYVPGRPAEEAALAALEATFGPQLENASVSLPPGITDVAPATLPNLRSGEELLVSGRLAGDLATGDVVLRGTVEGAPFTARWPVRVVASTSSGNAFVPRLWASQRIASLEAAGKGADVPRIVALSKGYGVLSRETSLLVLESEAMFRAFGVDRARPTVQWTGEEEVVEGSVGAAGGTFDLRASGRGAAGARTAPPMAPSRAGEGSGFGSLRSDGEAEDAAPAAEEAPSFSFADVPVGGAQPRAATGSERQQAEALALPNRESRRRARRRPVPPGRGGRWVRRVWFREAHLSAERDVSPRDRERAVEAEAALRANGDSRDRHRSAVRALSRAGDLVRAEEVARAWVARDRLDVEALTYLADVVGRLGRGDEALRLLSGVTDLQPENAVLQRRLANAFTRSGDDVRSCAHRVALAELEARSVRAGLDAREARGGRRRARAMRPSESETRVASALRCSRETAEPELTDALLAALPEDSRAFIERTSRGMHREEAVRGEVVVEGRFEGGDVDLSLITPEGTRLSWMGGRQNVVGSDARGAGRERLGLTRAPAGSYLVEVSRVDATQTGPIEGTVRLEVLGETRTLPFTLTGTHARIGRISVVRRWRIE